MKRVGSIYNRDASKSRDKAGKLPLKDRDINALRSDNRQHQNKRWRLELDNEQDSEEKFSYKVNPRGATQSDKKEITFSEGRYEQRQQGKEQDVVKKMACLTKIIAEINTLKACGLKANQEGKLMDIEDRLLEYERKLLQNEKLNYL